MDSTYRFRFLIYLAAFMLVMSLCFVYAEPLPSHNPLLFQQVSPQHSGFLADSPREPSFDPDALRAAVPVVLPQALQQVESISSHTRRGFFHRSRRTMAPTVVLSPWSESLVLQIVDDGPSRSKTVR